MGLNWDTVAIPRVLKSSEVVSVEGEQEGTHTGSHMWGSHNGRTDQEQNKEHARQAVGGFVPVDVAQSVFREVR